MSYYGEIVPPDISAFYDAARGRLGTPRMSALLGGDGRVRLGTEDYPDAEAEQGPWGRVVLREVTGPAVDRDEQPGRAHTGILQVFAEIDVSGAGGFPVHRHLLAIHAEAFRMLSGWVPGDLGRCVVDLFVFRRRAPTPPALDTDTGRWYSSAVYSYTAEAPREGG